MTTTYLSREGFKKLRADLDDLIQQKRELSLMIGEAREQGDLKENAGYQYAREKQGEVIRRMREIEEKLASAQLVDDTKIAKDEVRIGAKVTMLDVTSKDSFTYTFVGQDESDPSLGKLSVQSPLAQGVLGHKAGDTVAVTLPTGRKQIKIVKIER